MPGATDLSTLLKTMSPELSDESFVFVSLDPAKVPKDLQVEGSFREAEGTTLICELNEARKHSLCYQGTYRRITLRVHSPLEAVGFLSRIARELTAANISCNVVSGYYHDHLFVLESAADKALQALRKLSAHSD